MVDGSAIGIVDGGQKLLFINNYHCGENLATFPSSYIMPKGSPLMVRNHCAQAFRRQLKIIISLTGHYEA